MRREILAIFILSFFVLGVTHAQRHSRDSLRSLIDSDIDTTRINSLLRLANYYEGEDLDSTLYYAKLGLEEASKVSNDTLRGDAFHLVAMAFEKKSVYDSALYYYQIEEPIRIAQGDALKLGNVYNNYGLIADEQGDFKEAALRYIQALKQYESILDSSRMAITNVNLGVLYKSQGEFQRALSNYQTALLIFEKGSSNSDKVNATVTRGNIGSVLNNLTQYDRSIVYSTQAEKEYVDLGYPRYAAYPLSNIAISYDSLGLYQKADAAYNESLRIHKKHENTYEVANVSNAWAKCLVKQGKHKDALRIAEQALGAAESSKSYELIVDAQNNLAKIYGQLGQYRKGYEYQRKSLIGRDSIFQKEKTDAIFAAEEKYENEKKVKQLNETKAILLQSQLEVQKKNEQFYGASAIAIILGLLGYLLYNRQRNKNVQLQKEKELQLAVAKIESQNQLNEQRLRISRDLHDNIGAQLTFVISSLDNLKYGFDLKDKVSEKITGIGAFTRSTIGELRDTIWAMNKDDISMDDLKSRIHNFIEQAASSDDSINFDFIIDSGLRDMTVSSVVGMNIYRVIQESVNNAIKYAQPKHILVQVDKRNTGIAIKINDDGQGFDVNQIERGNGLSNMEKRSADIRGDLQIVSVPQEGTTIQLTVPAA